MSIKTKNPMTHSFILFVNQLVLKVAQRRNAVKNIILCMQLTVNAFLTLGTAYSELGMTPHPPQIPESIRTRASVCMRRMR